MTYMYFLSRHTPVTELVCPFKQLIIFPLLRFQTLIVVSQEPANNRILFSSVTIAMLKIVPLNHQKLILLKKYSNFDLKKNKVPPRFELGSLDSKSRVLTVTPQGLCFADQIYKSRFHNIFVLQKVFAI